jgi:hypothetical protein
MTSTATGHSMALERGTIVLAAYRPDRALLTRQLQTIQRQSERGWVCLVGVDGHDPETVATIRDLVGDDERFSVLDFATNVGFYRNFERLLELVDPGSAWVALADQDDSWDQHKLRNLKAALADPTVHLAVGQARVVDENGTVVGRTHRRQVPLATLILDNQVTGSLALLRPSVLSVALPFPEPTPSSYHDHWLGVVASALGGYVVVEELLQSYVQHSGNIIGEARGADLAARLRRLAGGGPAAALSRLSEERWGWRCRMARELIHRLPRAGVDPGVAAIAEGRLGRVVIRELVNATRTGDIGPARAGALALGAAARRHAEDVGLAP